MKAKEDLKELKENEEKKKQGSMDMNDPDHVIIEDFWNKIMRYLDANDRMEVLQTLAGEDGVEEAEMLA